MIVALGIFVDREAGVSAAAAAWSAASTSVPARVVDRGLTLMVGMVGNNDLGDWSPATAGVTPAGGARDGSPTWGCAPDAANVVGAQHADPAKTTASTAARLWTGITRFLSQYWAKHDHWDQRSVREPTTEGRARDIRHPPVRFPTIEYLEGRRFGHVVSYQG